MGNPYTRLKDSSWSENTIKINTTDEDGNKIMSGSEEKGFDFVEVKSATSRDWVALDDEEMRRAKSRNNDSKTTDKILKNICRKVAAITVAASLPAEIVEFDTNTQMTSQEKDQNISKLVEFYYSLWSVFTSELVKKINDNSLFIAAGEKNSSSMQDTRAGVALEVVNQQNDSPVANG